MTVRTGLEAGASGKVVLMREKFAAVRLWLNSHRSLVLYVGSGVLAVSMVAIMFATGFIQTTDGSSSTAKVPYLDQTMSVAADNTPSDATPSDMEVKQGLLPVKIVPSTQFINMVPGYVGSVSNAVVNSATGMTSAVFSPTGGKDLILASMVLPQQVSDLLAAYEKKNAAVTVSSATSGVSGAVAGGGYVPFAGRGPGVVSSTSSSAASSAAAPQASSTFLGLPSFMFVMLLILLFIAVLSLVMRNRARNHMVGGPYAHGGTSPVGGVNSSNSKKNKEPEAPPVPDVTFADVAGCEEAIEDMQEFVEFLKNPQRFTDVGAVMPKGALLVGPPGTGKTLLARAVAGEAGVPFYSAAGSDFVDTYVGVGARRVRELFAKAKAHEGGAIIFIDEIDAAGRKRSGDARGGHQEHESTLNALLVQMDGFEKFNIVVLGATNRDDMLDPALTRPGRLDRKIQVPLPDVQGREKILAVHASGRPLADDVDLNLIAKRTPGMSGADLAQVVNEACICAAREYRTVVTHRDFDESIAISLMGRGRKSAIISDEDKLLNAYHETGHAICGLVQKDGVSPAGISILPRGHAGGVTFFPSRDSGYLTRREAYSHLVTALGGMAAEQVLLGEGEFTTGPSSDLQQCTQMAFEMVTRYGMGEGLFVKSGDVLGAAGKVTDEAVAEAETLLRKALNDATSIITSHEQLFMTLVNALVEHETLDNSQILSIVAGETVVPTMAHPPAPRQGTPSKASYVVPQAAVKAPKKVPQVRVAAASLYKRIIGKPNQAPRSPQEG